MAELVERRLFQITVGAAGHQIVIKGRELRIILVESDRKFARRIIVTENNIGYCMAALLAGIPCL